MRVGVLTISDGCFHGEREDTSGAAIVEWCGDHEYDTARVAVVPDEADRIADTLEDWADSGEVDVVLTTGGTGLSPRDVTPEATRRVLQREAQGIAEAIRLKGLEKLPSAMLSRGLAGISGSTVVVNLAGSRSAVRDGMATLGPMAAQVIADLSRLDI